MPELATIEFLRSLEILEDDVVLTTGLRSHYYEVINKTINSSAEVGEDDIKRILTICCHDLSEHISLIPFILNTINAIIKRVHTFSGSELYLVEPAMSVINMIKTTVLSSKSEVLRIQAFEILLSFPKETLLAVAENHIDEVIEIFKLFHHLAIPVELRYKTLQILHRFLTVIPVDKRECFVKAYVDLWFLKIIPFAINCIGKPESYMDVIMLIEVLESLAEALADVDYTDDDSWLTFLESIYNPKKYPTLLKTLLLSAETEIVWHRLWMVLVKLLKDQITLSKNSKGSPINAMLPAVEKAFKLDADSRCKAFECWNCLIDNFSAENNELHVDKRIKLLVIPLTSNNARVEDIAVSKQQTWWHLIKQFQLVSHKLYDTAIIPYLHFCFGKSDSKKSIVIGITTDQLKLFSLQTLAELTGHSASCKCEISVEKLSGRLLNTTFLVNFWNDWIHALKTATWISSELDEQAAQLLSCIWTSFLTVMAELPPNNIRRDLFSDLLLLIVKSEKETKDVDLFHMTFGIIRPILLMDERFTQLLPMSVESDLDILVLSIFNLEYSKDYFKSLDHDSKDSSLEYLYNFILSIPLHSKVIDLLIGKMSSEHFLPLWNILAEVLLHPTFSKSTDDVVIKVLTWVIKSMNNMQLAGTYTRSLWQNCYLKYNDVNLCHEVLGVLRNYKMFAVLDCEVQKFIITAVVSCLLPCWSLPSVADYDFVQSILSKITRYEDVEDQVTMLMNPIKNISNNTDVAYNSCSKNIKFILPTLKHLMILIIKFFDKTPNNDSLALNLQSTIKYFEIVLNKYHKDLDLSHEICDILLELAQKLPPSPMKELVFVFLRDTTKNFDPKDPKVQKLQTVFNVLRKKDGSYVHKGRKTSILNTVVENGEEFVVIKSNWKFNPKKLTENQKEKFKRKREDIPALYQDLSQSQDNSKITAWKTDSQDTSLSSSKSNSKTANEIVPTMLKDALGAEIVPSIIEVISRDNGKSNNVATDKEIKKTTPSHATVQKEKRVHSMALKVIKNVRNLMEKSGLHNIEDPSDNLNVSMKADITASPLSSKKVNESVINSASLPIASDRPSRVKRTPKKYEDSLLTGSKKKRGHLYRSRSQSPIDNSACYDSENSLVFLNETLEKTAVKKDEGSKCGALRETCLNTSESNEPSKFSEIKQEDKKCDIIIKIGKDTKPMTIENNNENKNNDDTLCNDTLKSEKDKEGVLMENTSIMIPECTPKQNINKQETSKSSIKKKTPRIVKELNIDMVSGHPYLQQPSEKRTPRKCVVNSAKKKKNIVNSDNATKEVMEQSNSVIVNESQDKLPSLDEFPMSEDIIESSQDSTMTTVSVKSSKSKKNVVAMDDDSQVKNRTRTPSPKNEIAGNCPSTVSVKSSKSKKNVVVAIDDDSQVSNRTKTPSPKNEITKSDATLPVVIVQDVLSPSLRKKHINANSKTKSDQTRILIEDLIVAREKTPSPHMACKRNAGHIDTDPVILKKAPFSETKEINTSIKHNSKIIKTIKVPSPCQVTNSKASSIVLVNENNASKDDTIFTQNKTATSETQEGTENMDTEPTSSSDVIILVDDIPSPIAVESEVTYVGPETQELADADTLTLDSNFSEDHVTCEINEKTNGMNNLGSKKGHEVKSTLRLSGIPVKDCEGGGLSSPFKDDEQRQQDFLNNTLEISPIKIASPTQDSDTVTLPKPNSDYVLIKLSSPVHSNGEPYENMESPEIFTNDKTSPDKRNQSPPREEITVKNTSPSLSLKKNRNQVRPSGRAAQMLGLCVPDKLQLVINSESTVDSEETRKTGTLNTLAKRNLRKLYNTNDNYDSSDENEDVENFLKLKRLVPNAESSPSGPILKRKLADMVDEAIASPASKRKRVSFHDPPVSTTVSVLKYIEPNGLRSPQNSAIKKLERQNRVQTNMKSQKRLDNVFKLDTVLTKALESFSENKTTTNDDSQLSSLEQTPAVEIVKSSDLNDSDPICPDLIECKDPIANIATELSSPCMRTLLIKELQGKIDTIGDLAKLTELEINRLCIKSPKVKITRKVLNDYWLKISKDQEENNQIMEVDLSVDTPIVESKNDEPTDLVYRNTKIMKTNEMEMQTETIMVNNVDTQTSKISKHSESQTDESGFKPTADIIKTLLLERSDFIEELNNNLDDTKKSLIANTLTFEKKLDVVLEKTIDVNSALVLNEQLNPKSILQNNEKELTFLQELMLNRYRSKDLILFCSKLLQNVHERREDDAL